LDSIIGGIVGIGVSIDSIFDVPISRNKYSVIYANAKIDKQGLLMLSKNI
jgi:hypothetical protein